MTSQNATELARACVEALIGVGVRHAVLAPGSRNAPLSFALADAAATGALALHTRIDERTGAFLALGIAKTSRVPVAIVTTSGTAAANLHPAMMEAAHAGIPLIAVTADRPEWLRGTLANQTTDQVGIFGTAAASAVDVVEPDDLRFGLVGLGEGPVHLNVQFDEPLLPEDVFVPTATAPEREPWVRGTPYPLEQGRATVVVAGDDTGPGPRVLAEAAGWPLLAEPSSGARNGPNVIRSYRLLLGTELGQRIERAIVYGAPTLSRPVQRLLARDGIEVISRRARGRWAERPHPVVVEYDGPFEVESQADPAWLAAWQEADRSLSGRIDALVASEPGLTPYEVAGAVHRAVPAEGLLHIGASNPIRDLDLMAGAYPVGERRLIIANRGLAGIDGTVSTAIGAVLGRPHTARAILYVGDVTFLHDLTGLVIGPVEERPDLTIVVANDDGGSIFATLEQGAAPYGDRFEKLFGTPHGVDLASLCNGLRVPHWKVDNLGELEHALASPNSGIEVVEATLRRDNRRDLDARIRGLAG
ncbi:2-succinyl-5-enolpyruvyl-6-hydroxy-3-cyclohexene-1-carboxylic-acid synthase [Nocardioides marmoriginsengisoli]|uniref:2-succinyl-5-enolpyruvyl-6-hydroxy-3-cyclohexene-1-carboxylate synthase n=1 Tax=Nocardioides marmoriginsengisoli TaxID=661483 RepID=A0A3N0CG57_9ACTN|nr:2-succinyl-5-enolpyruvyl-6-hydroxy-3-cyclohexene-1-carboxylic-acid synthase [Nocardioides marmoriginsengisoli]RNL62289.1 2-succinyl-5-enolpyruvyl-6-hydroxy-3-cyclohexene-1-carboxylic-acid synthase [Nocardioides marmoriginsengisoli]